MKAIISIMMSYRSSYHSCSWVQTDFPLIVFMSIFWCQLPGELQTFPLLWQHRESNGLYWQCDPWYGSLPFVLMSDWVPFEKMTLKSFYCPHILKKPVHSAVTFRLPECVCSLRSIGVIRWVLLFFEDNQFLWIIHLDYISYVSWARQHFGWEKE